MNGLGCPVGLCDHTLSVDLNRYRIGVDGPAVHPNRVHHLEPGQVGILEEDNTHIGVEVLADGPNQFRDDLGEGFRSRQSRADRIEALEIESLRL